MGDDMAKTYEEYQAKLEVKAPLIKDNTGWLVDWFPENLPLENKHGAGTSFNGMLSEYIFPPEPYKGDAPDWDPAESKSVLAFADSYGFASGIMKYAPQDRIGRRQIVTTAPGNYTKEKIKSLLSEQWDMIIYACGIDDCKDNTPDEIHKQQKDVAHCLLLICKAIADNGKYCKQMVVLTADCFAEEREIHEQVGVSLIANSTLFGFCNVARLELDMPLQFIDTEWSLPETSMPYLSAECFRQETFGRAHVRILKSGRYVMRQINPTPHYTQNNVQVDLPETGQIAISGGNGGVAIIIGHYLMKKCFERGIKDLKFVFLSRSMKITDNNMPYWKALLEDGEKWGIEVEEAKCDIGDPEAVDKYVSEHADTLAGFIHSAGILADTLLFKITWEDFETSWVPKSRAALHMHNAVEKYGCPIKLWWMFSSAAVYGNMGQLNYAASNAFLDGLARHRRAMGKAGLAISWGAWGEVGMATTLDENTKRRYAMGPMPPFSNEEALRGTDIVVASGAAYGQVYKINPHMMVQHMVNTPAQMPNSALSGRFYSELMPPFQTQDFRAENYYDVFQHLRGFEADARKGLIYQKYVRTRATEDDADEYDEDM